MEKSPISRLLIISHQSNLCCVIINSFSVYITRQDNEIGSFKGAADLPILRRRNQSGWSSDGHFPIHKQRRGDATDRHVIFLAWQGKRCGTLRLCAAACEKADLRKEGSSRIYATHIVRGIRDESTFTRHDDQLAQSCTPSPSFFGWSPPDDRTACPFSSDRYRHE